MYRYRLINSQCCQYCIDTVINDGDVDDDEGVDTRSVRHWHYHANYYRLKNAQQSQFGAEDGSVQSGYWLN